MCGGESREGSWPSLAFLLKIKFPFPFTLSQIHLKFGLLVKKKGLNLLRVPMTKDL